MASARDAARDAKSRPVDDVATRVFVSGASVACATTVTNPLDVLKVRLQTAEHAGARARGLARTAAAIAREEGVGAFWRGMSPAVVRAVLYGGCRLGLDEPALGAYCAARGDDERAPRVSTRLFAGATSGALAAAALNPTELLKTRMQNATARASTWKHLRRAVREDGARSLWRGSALAMSRSAVLTATQVVTYGETKRRVIDMGVATEGVALHFAVASLTGVVTTFTTNPIDMIKTRVYVGEGASIARTFADVLTKQGPLGLFRGFSANYLRLGPQTMVTFVVAEFLREQLGLGAVV